MTDQPYHQLVDYLFSRREAILNNWRTACEQDTALNNVSSLSREEFNNLLPQVLDALGQRLLHQATSTDPARLAQTHGLHRWHKAHSLMETVRELSHLAQALYNELARFSELFAEPDLARLLLAHRQVAQLMQETVDGSLQQYDALQRLQAANRLATLQGAVNQMELVAKQQSEKLRTSAHDLRGSLSIIHSATQLLQMAEMSAADRAQFLAMLERNLETARTLLNGLMDLSRLEAGQETIRQETINAASLLRDIVEGIQPMATERSLILQADGPAQLTVTTDQHKLQRIARILLLNATQTIPSTPEQPGVVSVSWSQEGDSRWVFSVQDSGSGLSETSGGALGEQLRPTVEPTGVLSAAQSEPSMVLPNELLTTDQQQPADDLGLQLVKRLCDLLDANLDMERQAGQGTLFRVRLPIHAEQLVT